MVVGAAALDHVTTPEHLEEEFECGSRARRLCDRELMLDLPAESAHAVANHGDREAAFAVDESDDPLLNTWPFLLIARTGRIVTGHATTLRRGCDKNSVPPDARGFQHLASCTRRVTASRGNTQARLGFIHLRTVIVHGSPHIAMRRGPSLRPSSFVKGAPRMASEDSRLSNAARISSSRRRRLPPLFIGPRRARISTRPLGVR